MTTSCHGPSLGRLPSTNWEIRTISLKQLRILKTRTGQQTDEYWMVRGAVKGAVGMDCSNSFPHEELGYDAEQNHQHLKDDCLYFWIEVHKSPPDQWSSGWHAQLARCKWTQQTRLNSDITDVYIIQCVV